AAELSRYENAADRSRYMSMLAARGWTPKPSVPRRSTVRRGLSVIKQGAKRLAASLAVGPADWAPPAKPVTPIFESAASAVEHAYLRPRLRESSDQPFYLQPRPGFEGAIELVEPDGRDVYG